jgi:acyl carrier protein
MTNDQIFEKLKEILQATFEIDPSAVQLTSHLFEELDLDSIDAVDLAIQLQEMTGKRIKPDDFKSVRTVGDVVTTVQQLLASH